MWNSILNISIDPIHHIIPSIHLVPRPHFVLLVSPGNFNIVTGAAIGHDGAQWQGFEEGSEHKN